MNTWIVGRVPVAHLVTQPLFNEDTSLKKRGEKALEKALVVSSPGPDDTAGPKARWKGQPDEDTIEESEEPPPSAGIQPSPVRMHHRREVAQAGTDDGHD